MDSIQPSPQRLGRFELIRPLGQGGMGQVFLARDPSIGREVALKTISSDLVQTPKARDRFLNEAKAAGALSHGNLVTVHEFGEESGTLFLVMEYLEGEDLSALLRRRALTPAQALEIMAQICDGLAYAHAKGVLHRDVKPSNVRVIEQSGRLVAKLMDFGVARLPDSQLTGTGDRVGTLSYMAPEYLRGGQPTIQCDLYPVGMMLHEALTGELPGLSPTLPRGSRPQAPMAVPAKTGIVRDLPARLVPLLHRALAADPADRFPSAEAFATALRAALNQDALPPARLELPPITGPEPSRAPYGWIALLALSAAGILAWTLWRRAVIAPGSATPAAPSVASSVNVPSEPPKVSPPAAPPMRTAAQTATPAPVQPTDSGPDLSSDEGLVASRPDLVLMDAQRQLDRAPSDIRAHALRVASLYWMTRYQDMLAALQAAQQAGVRDDQLGSDPAVHAILDAERSAHRIPQSLFTQMQAYLPLPRNGQGQGPREDPSPHQRPDPSGPQSGAPPRQGR
ncbi:MAG: protein kinase [Acidobacteria bacterium]|nr:protein kinase [Acidobacteriota bacterium]